MTTRTRIHAATRALKATRDATGAAAVEFAIVASLLMFLLFGILDTGFFINANSVVANSVREGARAAALGATETTVRSRVASGVSGIPRYSSSLLTVTISCTLPSGTATPCTTPDLRGGSVAVSATYKYKWLTPFGLGTTDVVKRSEMIIE